jgi:hypothetical protein
MSTLRHYTEPPVQYGLFDETLALRDAEQVDDLPRSAQELVDVIGLHATIDLVKTFGGDEIKVPQVIDGNARMWSILVETIGRDAVVQLIARCGGTTIYVPTCRARLAQERDREIIRRFNKGDPFDNIRREYKMTRRHLYRVLKKPL